MGWWTTASPPPAVACGQPVRLSALWKPSCLLPKSNAWTRSWWRRETLSWSSLRTGRRSTRFVCLPATHRYAQKAQVMRFKVFIFTVKTQEVETKWHKAFSMKYFFILEHFINIWALEYDAFCKFCHIWAQIFILLLLHFVFPKRTIIKTGICLPSGAARVLDGAAQSRVSHRWVGHGHGEAACASAWRAETQTAAHHRTAWGE